jgi:hypothetical protein
MTNYEKLNEQLSELIIDLQLTKEELKEIEKIFDEKE